MRARTRNSIAAMLAGAAAAALITVSPEPPPTRADSRPADPANPATPPTVTADSLPTAQIDGVAWTQVVVGNTVFVGGRFANARPSGAAPGANQTPRSNFLAYDIRTGELIATIAPVFNAQVRTIAVSPDGTRLYVGGDFTSIDGLVRDRLAAFELPSMRLIGTFLPPVGYHVYALAVSPNNATLYVGGNFNAVGSQVRNKLAAFRTSDAALLSWAPNAQGGLVAALVVSPDGGRVVLGGKFATINGSSNPGYGLAAVNSSTGALVPWAANGLIRNGTDRAAIASLVSDGTNVYGAGWAQTSAGIGNLEGVFSASWNGGTVTWVADCHGDHYSVHVQGSAVYAAGHAHFCGNIGGFPQTGGDNSSLWTYNRALALSRAATGTVARNSTGGNYFNYEGQPSPSPLLWYPDLDQGTFTGQNQGPWHVSGNAQYTVIGGEFRNVNFVPQQGLARFAVATVAPNRRGPRLFGAAWVPTLSSTFAGTVRLSFGANWDRDNENLTYRIERNGIAVGTVTARSSFFQLPTLTYLDAGATPGAQATYRVVAVDPFGNEAPTNPGSVTVSNNGNRSPYTAAVFATAGVSSYWRLGETAGAFADIAGTGPLTLSGTATRGVAGSIANDVDRAITFANASLSTATAAAAPQTFSVETWFRTSSTRGGKLIGYGNARTGNSGTADRHLYLGNDGRVYFGVNVGSNQVISSPAGGLNNDRWHHVVGTFTAGAMRLYVDGVEVASRSGLAAQRAYDGFWRVGGDSLVGWTDRPTADFFAGTIDDAAVYTTALPAETVAGHWQIGSTGNQANTPPIASFTAATVNLAVSVDGRGSTDADGTIASWAWNFGDEATATGSTAARAYATAGTYVIALTVTDDDGATATTTRSVTVTAPPPGPQPFARDAFERTVANGFGTADLGGAWTINGASANFSVGDGAGRIAMPSPTSSSSAIVSASSTDTEVRFTVGTDKAVTGGSFFAAAIGRRVGNDDYRAKVRVQTTGTVDITIARVLNGVETSLGNVAIAGPVLAAGERVQVRFQATGTNPTTLRMKVWKVGAPEPAEWQLTSTDTTPALQVGGGVGVWVYLSSAATNAPVVAAFDNVWAGSAG